MHEFSHADPNDVESDYCCFSCGQYGWKDEMMRVENGAGAELQVCESCLDEIREIVTFKVPDDVIPIPLSEQEYVGFVTCGCEGTGVFHLDGSPEYAGFKSCDKPGIYQLPPDLGYWELDNQNHTLRFLGSVIPA